MKKKPNYFEMVLESEKDPFGLDGIEKAYGREKPEYCTHPENESCGDCSLMECNIDCRGNSIW